MIRVSVPFPTIRTRVPERLVLVPTTVYLTESWAGKYLLTLPDVQRRVDGGGPPS